MCKLQYQLPWNLLKTLLQCNAHKISGSIGLVHVLAHTCLSGKWHDASTCSLLQLGDSCHSYLNEYEFIYIYQQCIYMYAFISSAVHSFCSAHTALEIISLQFLAVGIKQWDFACINCDCRLWSQNTGTEHWRGWQIACFNFFLIILKSQITACPSGRTI